MPLQIPILKMLRALRPMFCSMGAVSVIGWGMVLGDIVPDPLSGGENLARQTTNSTLVAMVDEVVKLRVTHDACYVEVVFTMKNTSAEAETIPVGFPFFRNGELKDFQASVNDKTITVTDEKGDVAKQSTFGYPRPGPSWKLWKTTFPPGEPVIITVSYWTKLASTSWSCNPELQSAPQQLASLVPESERAGFAKQLEARRVSYILRTGSYWEGSIGRCRIEVSFDGMSTDNLSLNGLKFEKEQATITSDKIIWELKDYEPEQDVELTITPYITRKATLDLLERVQKKQTSPCAVLTATQIEYLNAAGRQPEAELTLLQFLNHCQDRVVIWGPRGNQDLPLDESVKVYNMVRQIIDPHRPQKSQSLSDQLDPRDILPTFQPNHPGAFVPAIEKICHRLKEQLMYVPPAGINFAKDYAQDIDTFLAWCERLTD